MIEWRGRCSLCPRACGADRSAGRGGFCREGAAPRVAWAGLHFGEEPPLTASGGSGTIFFSGCTLRCRYCQNDQLSQLGLGRELGCEELARLMLALQREGAENVNLVTGSHFTPVIVDAMDRARREGLVIPLLWNSSGYESPATLELLTPWIDVYLPDCKTLDPELSRRFMGEPDYPGVVQAALPAMVEARPLRFEAERLRQGVIVRHLVLPGYLGSTYGVLAWFRERLYGRALLSVMVQYTPNPRSTGRGAGPGGEAAERRVSEAEGRVVEARSEGQGGVPETRSEGRGWVPVRRVSQEEYQQVLDWLEELEIDEGFIQEPEADSDWLPDFTRRNPFPQAQARPVWHYADDRLP